MSYSKGKNPASTPTEKTTRVLIIGSELESPARTLEAGMFAVLENGLSDDCFELRGLSIQVRLRKEAYDHIRPVRGPQRGPIWYRKPIYALRLWQAVGREIRKGVEVVHFVWVGFPLLFRLIQWRFHSAGARSVCTVLNRHAPLARYRNSHKLIAHSPYVRKRLIAIGCKEADVLLLPPPVDTTHYFPRNVAPKPYFVFASGPRTPAQIEERGVRLLFQAFGRLQADGNPVKLIFLNRWPEGEGLLRKIAREFGATNVSIVSGDDLDVGELIGQSSGAILPYALQRVGDVPLSGIEALACGRPVITTRETGLADFLSGSIAGEVVPADPNALADAIAKVASDASDRAKSARALFERIYTQDFVGTVRSVYCVLSRIQV